jgi:undecaprenyl-diphosphatase
LIGLGTALAALLFFLWLAEEVLEGDTQSFDDNLRMLIHQHASSWLTVVMQVFSFTGSIACLLTLSGLIALYFVVIKHWRELALLTITLIGGLFLENGLKVSFHRPRPVSFFGTPTPATYSFPSGHALLSLCFYGMAAYLMTRRFKSNKARILVWSAVGLLVGFIGLSRIYLGVHYPSDVIAGYAAAALWVISLALADRFFRKRQNVGASVTPEESPAPSQRSPFSRRGLEAAQPGVPASRPPDEATSAPDDS